MTDYRHSLRRRAGGYEWAVSGPFNCEVARGFARSRTDASRAIDDAITADIQDRADGERTEHAAKFGPMTWVDDDLRSAK